MKIYFAGAIRGGRDDAELYNQIIKHTQTHGTVLTEHLGSPTLQKEGGKDSSHDQFIHDRDMEWIMDADCVIAEVSTPSLRVGYEVGRALENKKPILCIFRKKEGSLVSAMIAGSSEITTKEYFNLDSAKEIITEFLKTVN